MRVQALVCLFVLLGGIALWLRTPESPPAEAPRPAPEAPAEPAPAPPAAAAEVPSRIAAEDAAKTADDAVLVRVVDAASNRPVPAAQVLWYSANAAESWLLAGEHEARTLDPERYGREHGQTGVTGAQGTLRIPAARWTLVAARAGTHYGEAFARQSDRELVVSLHPDIALAIRTVDPNGRPVPGVRVRFTGTWRDAGKEPVAWSALLPASDASGHTNLPHVQELVTPRVARRLGQFSFSPDVQWQSAQLRASATQREGEPVDVDLLHLPAQPVDVVVPATGRVEFVLRGADGAPFAVQPGPQLFAVLVPAGGMGKPIERATHTAPWQADGRAVFEHVACGERLELLERSDWYAGQKFAGPVRPGEHLVVDVPVPADSVWIEGRLVGEDGKPWTRDALARIGGGHILPGNPLGRFCVPVPEHVGRQPLASLSADDDAVEAALVFAAPLEAGRNDLGIVVLRKPPLLVAGQVVVRGADDAAAVLKTLHAYVSSWPRGAAFGRADRQPVTIDAEGRFEVHGLPRNTDYAVVVDGNISAGGHRKFTPGATGVVLEVVVGATLEASFLVDPTWGMISVSFRRSDAPPDQHGTSVFASCGSGRVVATARGLVGGQYVVTAAKGAVVLAELSTTAAPGVAVADPSLRDVDLRNRVQQIQVTVTGERGAPTHDTKVAWRPMGADDTRWSVEPYLHHDGRGHAIVSAAAIELCVWATGHRAERRFAVLTDEAVVLRPLPQVRLRWAGAADLPTGCSAALLWERPTQELQPPGTEAPTLRGAAMVREALRAGPLPGLLQNGEATLTANVGERLQVRLQLRANGRQSAPIELLPRELDTATLVDGQVIELHADAAVVQAEVQKLMPK